MGVMTLDVATDVRAERAAQRAQADREELIERIARTLRDDGVVQPLPGLHLARVSSPGEPLHGVLEPSLRVIAQGKQRGAAGRGALSR